ncbi:endolytic transglycosylase MltG [uncultured Megasphaera sp.]|uniref:endolytic transglycosylase MltG n=1 Tax=uncultured Megasphaera sp. TaxID=165188 RepID=UPI0025FE0DED|nr:endolytic transglycosylase MltG [uncultured Megasphaera sp.]
MEEKENTTTKLHREKASARRRRKRGRRLITVLAGLVCLGIAGAAYGYFGPNFLLPYKSGYVHVRSDMTASEVGDVLTDKGYIASPLWFRAAATLTGQAGSIHAGEYTLDSRMSLHTLLQKLTSGKSEADRLVIPEGYTVREIAKAVAQNGRISEDDFLKAASSSDQLLPYMKGNRQVTYPTEGFLFPDTYFIPYDATADDVVAMMLKNFDAHLTAEMKAGIAKQNLSVYQFVTLASLIEKEAKFQEDRPLIASVFENRLKIHMKLQSDASISYAMGTHKAAYSISETEYNSPYNTYLYEGLPPGPIGNPGLDCMEAILHAPQTNYLYFVADKDGHNYFAATYDEHMKNVQEHMP